VKGDRVALEGHEQIRDHATQGFEGLLSVAGTKFTTARRVAERVTDTLMSKLQRKPVPCRTATTPLPGGSLRDIGLAIADARREFDEGLPTDTIPHLIAAYGSRYRDVMEIAGNHREWKTRLAPDSPVIGAELVLAARKEMAPTLADIVIRRTPLGALGHPGVAALTRAAAIVGAELGWTEDQRQREIAAVDRFYDLPHAIRP
jgi:glycerol-3-phosphate dehydrogenase